MRGNNDQIKMCPPLHKISLKSWIYGDYEYMEAYMDLEALFAITVAAAFMKSPPNDDAVCEEKRVNYKSSSTEKPWV